MRVVPVPCLTDNYAYLVVCDRTRTAAVVDPSEAAPIEEALERERLRLAAVWATHHHLDHVGGVEELVASHAGLEVLGHVHDRGRIPHLTRAVDDGDLVACGELRARILHNPGHTLGAITYCLGTSNDDGRAGGALFTGDTLFGAGCGRLFEGTAAMMARSLARLASLPSGFEVHFGHEYTLANLRFAAAVEPDNAAIARRTAEATARRAAGEPTTPSTIGLERATNPFLRAHLPAVAAAARAREPELGQAPTDVFAALRRWKDQFRAP